MKQRIFSLFTALCLCLCLCLLPTAVLATGEGGAATDKWDGSTATGFAGGTGTKDDPYQIATGAQLKYLEEQVNSKADYYSGKYLKLTADIDLDNQNWTPIGFWYGGIFQGSFDGGGHTISNLKIAGSLQACGLFGRIRAQYASIEIKDLTVSGSVTGNPLVGGVIGYCSSEDANSTIKITGCANSGTVTGSRNVGGVVGHCQIIGSGSITVAGCLNTGTVSRTEGSDETTFGAVTGDIQKTDLGNYDFSISGMGNYAGGWTGGWKIVEAPVTGGSSASTYSITASAAANGTVTISSKNAKKGAAVTVTVAPDKGYTLETLTILDKNGNEIALTDLGGGQYSFTMPKGKVTVEAAFTEETEETEEAAPLPAFSDVPADSYYHDAVLWAAKNDITGGVDETRFGPDLSCTRAQLVTFLWRAAGCPVVDYAINFSDVGDSYYTEAVRRAASLGIVGGYGNGQFGAEDTITREQMAAILYRFAQAMGMDTTQGGMSVREYKDYDSISDYAVAAVQWAVNSGVMQGYEGNLMPGQPCTRAQIVTMLYRLLGE